MSEIGMSALKKMVRRILPEALVEWIRERADRKACHAVFAYDANAFYGNSMESKKDDLRRVMTRISKRSHVLEKGLTMPEMRPGFGRDNVAALIDDIEIGLASSEKDACVIREAVSVVAEYVVVHQKNRYALDSALLTKIDAVLARCQSDPSVQPEMTQETYFADVNKAFDAFSASRHSFRQFEGSVDVEKIKRAVSLANNAPSACNRQPCKVHLVVDKEKVQQCLALQNGNRGFGHLVDKLIVLTADLRTVWLPERHDIYTNGGIYLMNLCYSLHFNKVPHCILNWSPPYQSSNSGELFPADVKMRKMLELNDAEVIIALVACGGVPEKFKLTQSSRLPVEKTWVVHS